MPSDYSPTDLAHARTIPSRWYLDPHMLVEESAKVFSGLLGSPLARFSCGSSSYTLTGGVSGEASLDVNVMSASGQVAFKTGVGEQRLKVVVGTQEDEATLSTSLTATGAQASEIDTKLAQ